MTPPARSALITWRSITRYGRRARWTAISRRVSTEALPCCYGIAAAWDSVRGCCLTLPIEVSAGLSSILVHRFSTRQGMQSNRSVCRYWLAASRIWVKARLAQTARRPPLRTACSSTGPCSQLMLRLRGTSQDDGLISRVRRYYPTLRKPAQSRGRQGRTDTGGCQFHTGSECDGTESCGLSFGPHGVTMASTLTPVFARCSPGIAAQAAECDSAPSSTQ